MDDLLQSINLFVPYEPTGSTDADINDALIIKAHDVLGEYNIKLYGTSAEALASFLNATHKILNGDAVQDDDEDDVDFLLSLVPNMYDGALDSVEGLLEYRVEDTTVPDISSVKFLPDDESLRELSHEVVASSKVSALVSDIERVTINDIAFIAMCKNELPETIVERCEEVGKIPSGIARTFTRSVETKIRGQEW